MSGMPTWEDMDRDAQRGDEEYHRQSEPGGRRDPKRESGQAPASASTSESEVEAPALPYSVSISCRTCGERMRKEWKSLESVPDKVDWVCSCGERWQTNHYRTAVRYTKPERP